MSQINPPAPKFFNGNGQEISQQALTQGFLNGSIRPLFGAGYGGYGGYGGLPRGGLGGFGGFAPIGAYGTAGTYWGGFPGVGVGAAPNSVYPGEFGFGGFNYGGTAGAYTNGYYPTVGVGVGAAPNSIYPGEYVPSVGAFAPGYPGVGVGAAPNTVYPGMYVPKRPQAQAPSYNANDTVTDNNGLTALQEKLQQQINQLKQRQAKVIIPDSPSSAPSAATPAPGEAVPTSHMVRWTLDHPDSESAKRLGLQNHNLHAYQKDNLAALVGKSEAQAHAGGMLESITDYVMAAVQLIGQFFSGGKDQKTYSELKAERVALRVASAINKNLTDAGYTAQAAPLSGVQLGADGNYTPIKDSQGQYTGMFAMERMAELGSKTAVQENAASLGVIPSAAQSQRIQQLLKEETAKLYADADVRGTVETYRQERAKNQWPDEENVRFANYHHDRISAIAERIAADTQLKQQGSYNPEEHRAEIANMVRGHIIQNHKELFNASAPAPKSSDIDLSHSGQLTPSDTPKSSNTVLPKTMGRAAASPAP